MAYGGGGVTGSNDASWQVGNFSTGTFRSSVRQQSWVTELQAGPALVRFTTNTSNFEFDLWNVFEVSLRRVENPAVRIDLLFEVEGSPATYPYLEISADANVLLMSAQRLPVPLLVPGFAGGLYADPATLIILDVAAPPAVGVDWRSGFDFLGFAGRLPALDVQAVRLGAEPSFSSPVSVRTNDF